MLFQKTGVPIPRNLPDPMWVALEAYANACKSGQAKTKAEAEAISQAAMQAAKAAIDADTDSIREHKNRRIKAKAFMESRRHFIQEMMGTLKEFTDKTAGAIVEQGRLAVAEFPEGRHYNSFDPAADLHLHIKPLYELLEKLHAENQAEIENLS